MTSPQTALSDTTLVIIPTFNEIENLPLITKRVREATPEVHILIVDDSSPDGTGELAGRWLDAEMAATGKAGIQTAEFLPLPAPAAGGWQTGQQVVSRQARQQDLATEQFGLAHQYFASGIHRIHLHRSGGSSGSGTAAHDWQYATFAGCQYVGLAPAVIM